MIDSCQHRAAQAVSACMCIASATLGSHPRISDHASRPLVFCTSSVYVLQLQFLGVVSQGQEVAVEATALAQGGDEGPTEAEISHHPGHALVSRNVNAHHEVSSLGFQSLPMLLYHIELTG